MTTLELIVRASACTAALILAVALFRARHATLASRLFGAALCVGVATYVACSGSSPVCSVGWLRPVALLAVEVPFLFWRLSVCLLAARFTLPPRRTCGW